MKKKKIKEEYKFEPVPGYYFPIYDFKLLQTKKEYRISKKKLIELFQLEGKIEDLFFPEYVDYFFNGRVDISRCIIKVVNTECGVPTTRDIQLPTNELCMILNLEVNFILYEIIKNKNDFIFRLIKTERNQEEIEEEQEEPEEKSFWRRTWR